MERISKPIELLKKVCREPVTKADEQYRLSAYCLRVDCEEGVLLYQTLTGEVLLLTPQEWEKREDEAALRAELIRGRFFVPCGLDEKKQADQIKHLIKLLKSEEKEKSSFVIFTTLDCNARCYYCYEKGRPRPVMSEQTARDAADYIAQTCGSEEIHLQWFGGEPLFNMSAIEIISKKLTDRGQKFKSMIVSNGYLFDAETVRKAREEWAVERVQITLDGTEEVYNRSKAYIYRERSPYQRVMRNIGLLLDAGISVQIRLNMDKNNANDLMALVDELSVRFGGRSGFKVYAALLGETGQAKVGRFDGVDAAMDRYAALGKKLKDLGLASEEGVSTKLTINNCMADRDGCFTILPDGRLGKCEHESEKKLVGSIYQRECDSAMLAAWKERLAVPECRDCAAYPVCRKLKMCEWYQNGCTELARRQEIYMLQQKVLNTYEKARREHENS